MKRTIIAMIMLIVLALQCAYATDWTKLGEAASGTISPGDSEFLHFEYTDTEKNRCLSTLQTRNQLNVLRRICNYLYSPVYV